jgi:hypothetical protein
LYNGAVYKVGEDGKLQQAGDSALPLGSQYKYGVTEAGEGSTAGVYLLRNDPGLAGGTVYTNVTDQRGNGQPTSYSIVPKAEGYYQAGGWQQPEKYLGPSANFYKYGSEYQHAGPSNSWDFNPPVNVNTAHPTGNYAEMPGDFKVKDPYAGATLNDINESRAGGKTSLAAVEGGLIGNVIQGRGVR